MDDRYFKENVQYLSFESLYSKIQAYISENYSELLMDTNDGAKRIALKEQLKNIISKYLRDNKVGMKEYSNSVLVQKIYSEMAQLSILTPLLDEERNDIEEININRWDDIKIHYDTGEVVRSQEVFRSAEHALDVIKRLLKQESDMVLDKGRPIVRGHLHNRIRLTVLGDGVIDKNVGISASLRIINPKSFKEEDFINRGTATKEMLDCLGILIRYGISMCITGETGSGKTTLLMYLASYVPDDKRIYCIEEDVREFDLTRRDEKGRVINNVVHTHTRKSDNQKGIDQDKLLETALTMNPDVIIVSEMKGKEANAAQEAARTGHTVLTTTHAAGCRATYWRMVTLCKKAVDLREESLEKLCKEAFPIVVFIRKDGDNVRRIKEITECYIDEEGKFKLSTLFEFVTVKNREDEKGRLQIEGYYQRVNDISCGLKSELINRNITDRLLKAVSGSGGEACICL